MAFESGRQKSGGRSKGTRNRVNLFNQDTIDKAKALIAKQVEQGDIEAAKLVIAYSLSKPATHAVGILADLEQVKTESEINRIEEKAKDAELFSI